MDEERNNDHREPWQWTHTEILNFGINMINYYQLNLEFYKIWLYVYHKDRLNALRIKKTPIWPSHVDRLWIRRCYAGRNWSGDRVYSSTDPSRTDGIDAKQSAHTSPAKRCLGKLTIPGQPIGCPSYQRPTPLPSCSAGKHRCCPGFAVRNAAASERRLNWSSQRNVRGGGANLPCYCAI